jgi:hypothetical protein
VVVVPETLLLFVSKATIVTPDSGAPLSATLPEKVFVGGGTPGLVSPPPPPPPPQAASTMAKAVAIQRPF